MGDSEDAARGDVSEEQLDEASEDSFPASDPPSYSEPIPDKDSEDGSDTGNGGISGSEPG